MQSVASTARVRAALALLAAAAALAAGCDGKGAGDAAPAPWRPPPGAALAAGHPRLKPTPARPPQSVPAPPDPAHVPP